MPSVFWRRSALGACAAKPAISGLAILGLVLAGLVLALPAKAAASDRTALEARLLADCQDGHLDEFDLTTAALIASGVEHACEVEGWRAAYESKRDEIAALAREFPVALRRLVVHRLLFERVLSGEYRRKASDLRTLVASGDYNCLSALVVYRDTCLEAGITVEIGAASGHVFALPPAGKDIEEPSSVRRITEVELLGRFYYNRGVLALERGEFALGTALLRTSLALDPQDADARENLLAGLNNWAAAEYRAGNFVAAELHVREGLALDAAYAPLVANRQLIERRIAAAASQQ